MFARLQGSLIAHWNTPLETRNIDTMASPLKMDFSTLHWSPAWVKSSHRASFATFKAKLNVVYLKTVQISTTILVPKDLKLNLLTAENVTCGEDKAL